MSFKPPESETSRPGEEAENRVAPDPETGYANGATPAEYGKGVGLAVLLNLAFLPFGFYYQRNLTRFWIFAVFDIVGKSLLLFFLWTWPRYTWGWPHILGVLLLTGGFQVFIVIETLRVHRREPMSDAIFMRTPHGWWFVPLFLIGFAIGAVLIEPVENRIIRAHNLPSSGMAPTLLKGDYVYSDYLTGTRDIRRGDIMIFEPPTESKKPYIQRLIGLPGEHIRLTAEKLEHDGKKVSVTRVYINGKPLPVQPLDEPVHQIRLDEIEIEPRLVLKEGRPGYRIIETILPEPIPADYGVWAKGRRLGPDEFFMLGDNRDDSKDSRYIGAIKRKQLLGRYMYTYFSVNFHYRTCPEIREKLKERAGPGPYFAPDWRRICGDPDLGGLAFFIRRFRRASIRWENIRAAY